MWGATCEECRAEFARKFQSTPPVWGATRDGYRCRLCDLISIHAPRVGGDSRTCGRWRCCMNFNPRPPCGGRPLTQRRCCAGLYFNPRPPCGGRLFSVAPDYKLSSISIHAPRVGGDEITPACPSTSGNFNPRPPCGGRRNRCMSREQNRDFNPRPPCGGRPANRGVLPTQVGISIHAPRVGGDGFRFYFAAGSGQFQSTPPVWGATSESR